MGVGVARDRSAVQLERRQRKVRRRSQGGEWRIGDEEGNGREGDGDERWRCAGVEVEGGGGRFEVTVGGEGWPGSA